MSPSARCLPNHTEETYQAFKVAVIERTHTWLERLSRTVAPQQIGSPPICGRIQELSLYRKVTVTCVYTQSHEAQYERIDLSYRPNRRDNGDSVLPRTALTARNGNDALREAGASDRARF
jgi:hypothetical protein